LNYISIIKYQYTYLCYIRAAGDARWPPARAHHCIADANMPSWRRPLSSASHPADDLAATVIYIGEKAGGAGRNAIGARRPFRPILHPKTKKIKMAADDGTSHPADGEDEGALLPISDRYVRARGRMEQCHG
jgi:hypothetical protein